MYPYQGTGAPPSLPLDPHIEVLPHPVQLLEQGRCLLLLHIYHFACEAHLRLVSNLLLRVRRAERDRVQARDLHTLIVGVGARRLHPHRCGLSDETMVARPYPAQVQYPRWRT